MKKSLVSLAVLACAAMAAAAVQAAGVNLQALLTPEVAAGLTGLGAAFGTTRYVTAGRVLDYVAGANITSGQVLVVGTKIGVALAAISNGSTGSVQIAGVFTLPKKAADVIAQGANVYWDSVTNGGEITTTVGSNTLAGVAYVAAAGATTTVQVLLNNMPGSA
jgi:predicted RecA/RadA family phage recombinase